MQLNSLIIAAIATLATSVAGQRLSGAACDDHGVASCCTDKSGVDQGKYDACCNAAARE